MEFLREFVEAGGMTLETAGALRHGSIIWALAKIDKAKFTLPGNDQNQTYFNISTSHDGSQETTGFFSNIRVVCANTHRMAHAGKKGRTFSHKHATVFDDAARQSAKLQVGLAVEATEKYAEFAYKLAETKVNSGDTLQYVANVAGIKLEKGDTPDWWKTPELCPTP